MANPLADALTRSKLFGFDLNAAGAVAPIAEGALNIANIPRYGMTERERSQLIGRLPESPEYGPAGERYTSSFLFGRRHPLVAEALIGPTNAITDMMYGQKLAPVAASGAEAGREQYFSELGGGLGIDALIEQEDQLRKVKQARKAGQTLPPESRIDIDVLRRVLESQ